MILLAGKFGAKEKGPGEREVSTLNDPSLVLYVMLAPNQGFKVKPLARIHH